MTRTDAIDRVRQHLRSGDFLTELNRRVGYRTESQNGERQETLRAYLEEEMHPAFSQLGFVTRTIESPTGKNPYLLAEYREDSSRPTVLMYGHGDVVDGMEGEWRDGLDPWRTTTVGDRVYGRGTADNKGQHSINLSALRAVRGARGGRLGFDAKFLIETGEEIGSPDLREVCEQLRGDLDADLFLASDGPRLSAERPTIFLGCRGGIRIRLDVDLRDGAHHSGNWGGLLANPATILANAIACLVDGHGRLLLDDLKPPRMSNQVRAALADVTIEPAPDEPALSPDWGEDGLSPAERLYAWNTLEVLAMSSGNIAKPANAIPGNAQAMLQLRFVVGTKTDAIVAAIQQRFDRLRTADGPRAHHAKLSGLPDRSEQPLDQLGDAVGSPHHRQGACVAPEFRRLAAQRRLRRHTWPADPLGTALLSRLFPACAERTYSSVRDRRGVEPDGWPVLGPGRNATDILSNVRRVIALPSGERPPQGEMNFARQSG